MIIYNPFCPKIKRHYDIINNNGVKMIYIDKKKGKIMNEYLNIMILNGVDIGISRIELNEGELYIVDKDSKYSLCVHIYITGKKLTM